ncbi:lipoprotein-anchoring transpeptidase ErfK/SrfK [Aurantimonas endophytica]|uniref:Lipoprotein-anchoring transpeptidase ErfK/SrfK n=1 Tax=Aurantimonas endophytica TaxID=1522175 RepID=A0A7W6MQA3_9HYPH|nr:L,D-transpeptidase [Aurantimonas endophytica]MBB4003737.1 lipoprotein-anchoring transpeptidase ErfK/SrfK [Aurantimonas endophytica]
MLSAISRRLCLQTLAVVAVLCIGGQPQAAGAAERVRIDTGGLGAGTIMVRTSERRLYLVVGPGTAIGYDVGVGRADRQWTGTASITGKYLRPNWAPPLAVLKDRPDLPEMIPSGAPNNPMGEAAMTLSGGEYAIHGTNRPGSIGGFVSYGCIRMHNADILDLYERVAVGTPVTVMR